MLFILFLQHENHIEHIIYMNLPSDFVTRTRSLMGEEQFEKLAEALQHDTPVSIRLNRNKCKSVPAESTSIPWCETGYYLSTRPTFTFDPLFHAGSYYVQEASSMFVEQALRQYVHEPVVMLDLCAAPGGKSTLARSVLPEGSMLVANEVMRNRSQVLAENLIKWGDEGVVVTNNDPADFAPLQAVFDVIQTDVPCSGEGMFRKDPAVIKTWEEERPEYFAKLQKDILKNGVRMLRPGGKLLYSTCTFAPVENEGSISWILEQCPEMELIPIEGYEGFSEGNPAWGDGREELRRCVRIWPHKMKGEGHFLALLKKSEDAPETRIRLEPPTRMDKKNKAVLEEFFRDCQWKPDWERGQIKGEKVYLVPELPAKLNGIHFLRNGLYLGDLKKNRFEPSQQLAMTLKASDYAGSVSLSPEDERIGRYLRGETLLLEPGEATREKGWILVCVDQYALGWGKLVNGVLKNKYWSGWRLKS